MKINGLNVDAQAIADGLYEIICAKGEDHIVAFGMIPKWIMDTMETMLREKIIRITCQQMQFNEAETGHLLELDKLGMLTGETGFSENLIKETMRPIVHEVSVGIYRAADKAGRMRV